MAAKNKELLCTCGCGLQATWLCTGIDYDPTKPNGLGDPFIDEPCCESAAHYLEENSSAFEHPFSKKKYTDVKIFKE